MGYLGEIRGLFEIKFILDEGLFANILGAGVFLQKGKKGGGFLSKIKERGGAFGLNALSFPFLHPAEQGRRR